jgi:hypothetical protein
MFGHKQRVQVVDHLHHNTCFLAGRPDRSRVAQTGHEFLTTLLPTCFRAYCAVAWNEVMLAVTPLAR